MAGTPAAVLNDGGTTPGPARRKWHRIAAVRSAIPVRNTTFRRCLPAATANQGLHEQKDLYAGGSVIEQIAAGLRTGTAAENGGRCMISMRISAAEPGAAARLNARPAAQPRFRYFSNSGRLAAIPASMFMSKHSSESRSS